MVQDILKLTLESLGHTVKKTLCEHFNYTRQELFDIIRVKEIKTYDGLLDTYGKGDGCEICKPAAASIFASLWNEPILEQATIQDTNDRFLANIQRDGTYSVVPRMWGGLTSAKGVYQSARGPVRSEWRREGGTLHLEIEIQSHVDHLEAIFEHFELTEDEANGIRYANAAELFGELEPVLAAE